MLFIILKVHSMIKLLVHCHFVFNHCVIFTLGLNGAEVFAAFSTRLYLSFSVHGVLKLLLKLAFDDGSLKAGLGHSF